MSPYSNHEREKDETETALNRMVEDRLYWQARELRSNPGSSRRGRERGEMRRNEDERGSRAKSSFLLIDQERRGSGEVYSAAFTSKPRWMRSDFSISEIRKASSSAWPPLRRGSQWVW